MKFIGIVNLAKPTGMTSRRAIDGVARLARPAKVGHAGTLDPLASGVLVTCVGSATRLIEYVQQMRKHYAARFLLGRHSDTEDIEGAVVELADPPIPTRAAIEAALPRFTGVIMQRPPDYSALKVEGRRAYDLARAGAAVELAPRPVEVYSLTVRGYDYPELRLDIECGSGTYVRSLGRDLALSLGTQAVMAALERTAIGSFTLADAVAPDTLTPDNFREHLRSPLAALGELPAVSLGDDETARIARGQTIVLSPARVTAASGAAFDSGSDAAINSGSGSVSNVGRDVTQLGGELVAIDSAGRLVAVLQRAADGTCSIVKNFSEAP